MLEWFKCPDGEITPVKECLTKCRMVEDCPGCGGIGDILCTTCNGTGKIAKRCETLPYLHLAASEREWTGEASTTQLLNGTMHTFLKITQPYVVDPDDMAFAIHGTRSHTQLESKAKELGLTAELSTTNDGRNIIDLIEYEDGILTLTDTKTWGSFRVAKVLGIVEAGKKPDPSGEVYKRSGAWGKAGSVKMVTVFQAMPQHADNYEAELQLNRYRLMLEETGIHVDRMRVHVIVRDGGLAVARSRGIERNTYLVPVMRMDNGEVKGYFDYNADCLQEALAQGEWHEPCDNRECWDGVRCRDYCEVAMYCPKGLIEKGVK